MGSSFPTAIDTGSDLPDAATLHAQTLGSFPHSALHENANEAILALETKVGATASVDTSSHDYLIAALQTAVTALEALTATPLVPVGGLLLYGGAAAPSGFLMADGSAVSRTTYADLFAVYATTFGIGNGTTTFNVMDMRNRVGVGAGGLYARGTTGGEATHVLSVSELPTVVYRDDTGGVHFPDGGVYTIGGNIGGGQAHNNLQPYTALNFIIKT